MDQKTKHTTTTTTTTASSTIPFDFTSPSPITDPSSSSSSTTTMNVIISRSKLGNIYSRDEIEAMQSKYLYQLRRLYEQQGTCYTAGCTIRPANWATLKQGVFVCVSCAQKLRADASNRVKNCLGTYLWHPDEMLKMMMKKE